MTVGPRPVLLLLLLAGLRARWPICCSIAAVHIVDVTLFSRNFN